MSHTEQIVEKIKHYAILVIGNLSEATSCTLKVRVVAMIHKKKG